MTAYRKGRSEFPPLHNFDTGLQASQWITSLPGVFAPRRDNRYPLTRRLVSPVLPYNICPLSYPTVCMYIRIVGEKLHPLFRSSLISTISPISNLNIALFQCMHNICNWRGKFITYRSLFLVTLSTSFSY
jgi:hypothetical protein